MKKKILKIFSLILFFIFSYCLISNGAEVGDINQDGKITSDDLNSFTGVFAFILYKISFSLL